MDENDYGLIICENCGDEVQDIESHNCDICGATLCGDCVCENCENGL